MSARNTRASLLGDHSTSAMEVKSGSGPEMLTAGREPSTGAR